MGSIPISSTNSDNGLRNQPYQFSIIEAHDGRLWASANEPRGAVFQFTVPASAR